tara:strand:+ start:473 stop:589 length:117 start_codon:yes stop_codon:yes gene_type:complete
MLKIYFFSKTTESRFDLIQEYAAKKIDYQIIINYGQTT